MSKSKDERFGKSEPNSAVRYFCVKTNLPDSFRQTASPLRMFGLFSDIGFSVNQKHGVFSNRFGFDEIVCDNYRARERICEPAYLDGGTDENEDTTRNQSADEIPAVGAAILRATGAVIKVCDGQCRRRTPAVSPDRDAQTQWWYRRDVTDRVGSE